MDCLRCSGADVDEATVLCGRDCLGARALGHQAAVAHCHPEIGQPMGGPGFDLVDCVSLGVGRGRRSAIRLRAAHAAGLAGAEGGRASGNHAFGLRTAEAGAAGIRRVGLHRCRTGTVMGFESPRAC